MENLKLLDQEGLLNSLKKLISDERRVTNEILHYLSEVESRMIYAELGFPSLYEFCTQYLQYSAGSAYRRIQSMRLLKSLPQEAREAAEVKIREGKLNLTHLSLVHGFLRAEKKEAGKTYSTDEKVELLAGIEGKSKREVEQALAAIQPAVFQRERERVLTLELTEIVFAANRPLMAKLQRAREVLAHVDPHLTYADLIERMADSFLAHHDPMRRQSPTDALQNTPPAEKTVEGNSNEDPVVQTQAGHSPSKKDTSRYIPIRIRRAVWARDGGQCTYKDPDSGRKCSSRFMLELDHIEPHALGGPSIADNLRLRCRTHNLLYSRKVYGARGAPKEACPADS